MTDEPHEPREPAQTPDPATGERGGQAGGPAEERPAGERTGASPSSEPRSGGASQGDRPAGQPAYGNRGAGPPARKPGSRPYDNRQQGRPGGGRPYADRPGSGRASVGGPGGQRPGARPPGRPGQRPYGRGDQARGSGPRRDGPPGERRPFDGPAHPERHVDYRRQDRSGGQRPGFGGPRPGPGTGVRDDRARGPRGPRTDWDRRERPGPPRLPLGPSPAELLADDEEIVAGRRPVEEAFAARREARRLLVVPERRAALDQLVLHATTLRIPVVEVEGGTITAVSGFDGHQGVALVVAPRRWATLDEVLALARSRHEPPFLLALDHLEDPQNVGTLLRSAEACGVHGVIFPTRGAAPISPAAIKTSAGAIEHLLLVPLDDLASGLVDLHARGVRVIGADGDAPMTVREVDLRGPVVIVTGSEGRGLNAKVRKRVDLMARIPMRGKVASLNASVAGSVFLFEAAAQRALPEAERPSDAPVPEPPLPESPVPAATPTPSGVVSPAPPAAGSEAEPGPSPVAESPSASSTEPAPAGAGSDDLLPEAPPPTRPDQPG